MNPETLADIPQREALESDTAAPFKSSEARNMYKGLSTRARYIAGTLIDNPTIRYTGNYVADKISTFASERFHKYFQAPIDRLGHKIDVLASTASLIRQQETLKIYPN